MKQTPYFVGDIGETVEPAMFDPSNCLIDDARYSYEGNWAFCRFDSDEIYGARFGFGRGGFDLSDYGVTTPLDKSFLMLHCEVMTREGARLWIGSGRYRAPQMQLANAGVSARLKAGGRELIHVTGWPTVGWRYVTDDGELELQARLDLENVTILPDCVMPNNRFAMWLAIGRVECAVRFQDQRTKVTGTVFYDHPRINVVSHSVPPFGWYIYTPIHFSDGSSRASYYAHDGYGKPVPGYCFGLYVDALGHATWLPESECSDFRLDADGKPASWQSRWRAPGFAAEITSQVKPTGILKAWGGPSVAQTRKQNTNMPLIFDSFGTVQCGSRTVSVEGGGLAEYLARANHTPLLP